jgi:hypothetical protein
MSITIMAGLGFATLLTLLVVPVLYASLFKDKKALDKKDKEERIELKT